jgi:hypothetical protein
MRRDQPDAGRESSCAQRCPAGPFVAIVLVGAPTITKADAMVMAAQSKLDIR